MHRVVRKDGTSTHRNRRRVEQDYILERRWRREVGRTESAFSRMYWSGADTQPRMVRAITWTEARLMVVRKRATLTHPHGLRVLVGQQGQQGGEAAQPSRKQDEEGKLLLRID